MIVIIISPCCNNWWIHVIDYWCKISILAKLAFYPSVFFLGKWKANVIICNEVILSHVEALFIIVFVVGKDSIVAMNLRFILTVRRSVFIINGIVEQVYALLNF